MASAARKADAAAIRQFIGELAGQPWLAGSRRSWWSSFVFHHSDVRNAARALNEGRLACRSHLEASGGLVVDSASPEVIAHTSGWVKDYVRLYFRPRTPTQYRWEGMRPRATLYHGRAHCAVPIFFLFDSEEVLTIEGSLFSNGNLGSEGAAVGSSAEFLRGLDFQKIYSVGPHDPVDRSIPFSRCAEVAVRGELDLGDLKSILARTNAERETLLSLLEPAALRRWGDRIGVDSRLDLFERKWTFVERAELTDDETTLELSPDTLTPGPFEFRAELRDLGTRRVYQHVEQGFYSTPRVTLAVPESIWSYRLRVTLDGNLAYQGEHFSGLPF